MSADDRVRELEDRCALLGAEAQALRTELDAVHADAFHWLISARGRPPKPFACEHPAQPNLVSVVIPAYKATRFLEACVRSVWAQQTPPDVSTEILICEDGSPDDTHHLALELQRKSRIPMQVLVHPGGVNRGVAATRNLGLRAARGAFVALLDADDTWLPNRLAVQLDHFARHPAAQCVCSLGYNLDANGNPVKGWNGTLIAGDHRNTPPPDDVSPPYTFDQMVRTYPIVNSTLLIRRSAVEAVGGYPEVMAHQAEDWLLTAKLSLLAPIHLIEEKLINYTCHGDSYTSFYNYMGLAYGVRVEFLCHLLHWMIPQPAYRARAEKVFRREFPTLLACYRPVAHLLRDFFAKHDLTSPARAEAFEGYLLALQHELEELRAYHRRKERVLAPLRLVPGLKPALRALKRLGSNAVARRSA